MKKVQTQKLDNGLQLIGETSTSHQSACIGFFVSTGSRDEVPKESGISHFLEHMLFKGTPSRSALEISHGMSDIGAQSNAYTSEEMTVYHGAILPEYFPQFQEILSDMMRPSLDPDEFNMEKKVILEEIALYQDRPFWYLYEQAEECFFNGHTGGNSVLGSVDSVSAIDVDLMRDYFSRRYSPSNIVLVGSGNFDWKQFVADAEKYCGSWEDIETGREAQELTPFVGKKEYRKENLNQAHLLMLSKSAGATEDERYPLSILSHILGDTTGSKLYWGLVDPGLVESAQCDNHERSDVGVFNLYLSCDEENLEEASSIAKKILASPLDFTDDELEQAKTKLITRIVLSGELPYGRLMSLGNSWAHRRELHSLKEVIDKVRNVSRSSIEAALAKYPLTEWGEFTLLPQ